MNNSRFVVREGHFHIADKESYVLTGWFEGAGMPQEEPAGSLFEAFADRERLRISVLCFQDEAARQNTQNMIWKWLRNMSLLQSCRPACPDTAA